MKLAIVSTTINGERGYLPFDAIAAKAAGFEVTFVIAGDKGAKPFDTSKFQCAVEYMEPAAQERFAISAVIPWRDPRRRPLAWLRAIELAPDYILSVDDDNIPNADYFEQWHAVLTSPVASEVERIPAVSGPPWHNYLRTSDGPLPVYPRGYPLPYRGVAATRIVPAPQAIRPEQIGVYQGISFGDPDMDALTRIAYEKPVKISKVSESNFCLRDVWSPYNMQSTVFSKKLFPLPILWPNSGRYDDIYASYAWQQLLFNNGMYAYVGEPFNVQDRGQRDIFKGDFKLEVDGYRDSHEVWAEITTIKEQQGIPFLEALSNLKHPAIQKEKAFFDAYLSDIGKIIA
jgi:hypothetical protein